MSAQPEAGCLVGASRDESQVTGRARRVVAVDPLEHRNWDALLPVAAGSSFFHTRAWAGVLCDTYHHRPFYLCSFDGNDLDALLPIMEVHSPVFGRRGVSLPFTDICPALAPNPDGFRALFDAAVKLGTERHWRYLELRGGVYDGIASEPSLAFYTHDLDLEPGVDALYKRLESSVRRGLRKAKESGLQVSFSHSLEAMEDFYKLHCLTRQRHGVPPQPFSFFSNIARHVLQEERGFVVTAKLGSRPVAAGVFLHDQSEAIYKFGASDYAFQHLRPNNLVMWEAIRHLARNGFGRLTMGRTSLSNAGLRRFKLSFGASERTVTYCKYDFGTKSFETDRDRADSWMNVVFRFLPRPLLRFAGRVLYPHMA